MRQTSHHLEAARKELKEAIEKATHNPATQKELSRLIAKFTAQSVRHDRVYRSSNETILKLADILFNGRPA